MVLSKGGCNLLSNPFPHLPFGQPGPSHHMMTSRKATVPSKQSHLEECKQSSHSQHSFLVEPKSRPLSTFYYGSRVGRNSSSFSSEAGGQGSESGRVLTNSRPLYPHKKKKSPSNSHKKLGIRRRGMLS